MMTGICSSFGLTSSSRRATPASPPLSCPSATAAW